mmetsp:Transcript_32415/g.44413  ORF Transcript_32415/g.44413 Transcript_32415/m.44413 type:complete len:608 (+) Transcript_32415:11-1834(+)
MSVSPYVDSQSQDDSSSVSSSIESISIKTSDAKLSQLHRSAEKRGGLSKLKARYQSLQTYEQMLKEQALKRMQVGLRKILELHMPVELSSICGCLHLKVQEKGSNSIDQILQYASATEELDKEKVFNILKFMWEGPLWEYLQSTGHPIYSMRTDPKYTIMQLWENGGFLEGANKFNPHFIAREVQSRYDWVQSEDIRCRLEKLRIAQEASKAAETKIIAEHDYTHILTYFKKMYELRNMENSFREYLITELEGIRGQIDSGLAIARVYREQLKEAKEFSISTANKLNQTLATAESVSDSLIAEKLQMEADLQGLVKVLDSYDECEKIRRTNGGGGYNPLKMRWSLTSSITLKTLEAKLQDYKSLRDSGDDQLREKCRDQAAEFDALQKRILQLEGQLEEKTVECRNEESKKELFKAAMESLARKMSRQEVLQKSAAQQSWSSSMRSAAKTLQMEQKLHRVKPLLLAGLKHTNKTVYEICFTLLSFLDILPPQEYHELLDELGMTPQDHLSLAVGRHFEQAKSKIRSIKSFKTGANSSEKLSKSAASPKRKDESQTSSKSKGSKSGGGSSKNKSSSNASIASNTSSKSESTKVSTKGKSSGGAVKKKK